MKMIRSALNERSATLYEQFACLCVARRQAKADRLEAVIKRNLDGLGYGA